MPGNWKKKRFVQTIFESSIIIIIIIIKNMFIMKNLTDFRKTVETGVDPPLNTGHLILYRIAFAPVRKS